MKKHVTTFESFLNESGFHAALAKAKEQGLEEFEFAGKKYKVQQDALEERKESVNEENTLYLTFSPELAKELEKDLAPLIKAYKMESPRISTSTLGRGIPVISAVGYDLITGGSWVAGTFFTKKDAEAAKDLFDKTEVKSTQSVKSIVKPSSLGITLFGDQMQTLAAQKNLKIDWDEIRAKVEEDWKNFQERNK